VTVLLALCHVASLQDHMRQKSQEKASSVQEVTTTHRNGKLHFLTHIDKCVASLIVCAGWNISADVNSSDFLPMSFSVLFYSLNVLLRHGLSVLSIFRVLEIPIAEEFLTKTGRKSASSAGLRNRVAAFSLVRLNP